MDKKLLEMKKAFFKKEYISDRKWLENVLHDDYKECGKSGTLWNKSDVVEGLLSCTGDRNITIYNFSCEKIVEHSWIVHYITVSGKDKFYRTSIWCKNNQLQLIYHQATKLSCKVELDKA